MQHVNNMFLRDIEHAFKRFESHDTCGLIEFDLLVNVIRETHNSLSKLLVLIRTIKFVYYFILLLFLFPLSLAFRSI
jgi:hypothetical protein